MANSYSVTLKTAADDGTNLYCFMEITSGGTTFPIIPAIFPSGTTQALVKAYMQNIANNQPTLAQAIADLINVPVKGV